MRVEAVALQLVRETNSNGRGSLVKVNLNRDAYPGVMLDYQMQDDGQGWYLVERAAGDDSTASTATSRTYWFKAEELTQVSNQ